MSEAPVIFNERVLADGETFIGSIHLNSPKTFNSLTLEMVELMQVQLNKWQSNDALVAVFLDGEGEKAFCAGGDVKSLFNGKQGSASSIDNPEAINFFDKEYTLDYSLHTFNKPIIVWGNGVVMGGGLGLMTGCEHRIVTETTRSAMPEITIGLFPDVGGSWFLNKSPGCSGLFLGLTGVNINAHDAIYLGLANRFIKNEYKDALVEGLCSLSAQAIAKGGITPLLKSFQEKSRDALPISQLKSHANLIDQLCDFENIEEVVKAIVELADESESEWLQSAGKTLKGGCPITAHLVFEQLKRGKYLSLREVFDMERKISAQCMRQEDFYEGVRALLIDKDKSPKWTHTSVADVPQGFVDGYFK
jgi:enoyl-CoA hydratase/carnithine racemase